MQGNHRPWRVALYLLASLGVAFGLQGCNTFGLRMQSPIVKVKDSRIGPGKMTPDGIQSELMSFTDNFSGVVAQRWNEAGSAKPTPGAETEDQDDAVDPNRARRSAHERKLASVSAALSIASSPNPMVAVADMITLVTLERTKLEKPTTAELFGAEAAANLLATYRELEDSIWRIGKRALTARQQQELKDVIQEWIDAHPDQNYVASVRLEDFAAMRQQMVAPEKESGNLLSLVMLDPLAGLDPAKREVRESRMLGARAFFQLSRMPTILKWQAESFYMGFFQAPQVKESLDAVSKVSDAADRVSKAAQQLPEDFAVERQAALDQFFAGIADQREEFLTSIDASQDKLRGTLKEFGTAVEATDNLANSLTTAARAIESTADRIMPERGWKQRNLNRTQGREGSPGIRLPWSRPPSPRRT